MWEGGKLSDGQSVGVFGKVGPTTPQSVVEPVQCSEEYPGTLSLSRSRWEGSPSRSLEDPTNKGGKTKNRKEKPDLCTDRVRDL